MNRRILYAVCFLGFIHFFIFISASAQIVIQRNLNIEDGLVYSQVLSTYQDSKGYMWFGTSNGISRWDGIKFKNFYTSNKVSFDNVKMITEINDNDLFIATGSGPLILKDGNFSKPKNCPKSLETSINQLIKLKDGTIFLAAEDSGLWKYEGNNFAKISTPAGINNLHVISLAKMNNGNLMTGTLENGLFLLENDQLKSFDLFTKKIPADISFIYQDKNDNIFIGTNKDGLYLFNGKELIKYLNNNREFGNSINYISGSTTGKIYIASNKGIAIIKDLEVESIINTQNGLANNFVWCVTEDQQGIIYFGTDGGGINIYRPEIYKTYNEMSGLPNNTVWSICESSENKYYFSTDAGVAVLDQSKIDLMTTKNGLSDNMVITVFESNQNELFFGTNDFGVDVFKNGRFKNISTNNGLTSNSVWSIIEDEKSRIYFGTYDGGICVYENGQIVDTIDTKDGLPNDYIVSAYKDKNGIIYFGTDKGGLVRLVNGQLDKNFHLFPESTIWSIYKNQAGNFFYGTDKNGLICVSNGKTDTITIDDGLSNNAILGIMGDDSGNLYLTTDNGLNILDCNLEKPSIRIKTSEDGLASNECNQGAFLRDSQGKLWIGTIKGVTCYDPSLDFPSKLPPKTHITYMRVFDKEIFLKSESEFVFKYFENFIQFNFIGIDLKAPHKVNYRYRLDGTESDWIYTDYPNVQFANLPNNDYTFEVQAGNEWGAWSESASLTFSILPPYWATWWFRLLIFIALAGIVSILIYLRFRSLLAIERVRSKIAADLHDDIGSGLSEINILSAVAESKTPPESKKYIENELSKISKTAGLMIDNMSDIVWMVNPKNDLMVDLVARLKDNFNDMFDAKGIIFKSENSKALEKIRLTMEQRQNIFLIFKEAINNAIKYSGCDSLKLCVKQQRKMLQISLEDDGKGFEIENIKKGNGLNNMEMRAEKIKGKLIIDSKLEKGTMINLSVKI